MTDKELKKLSRAELLEILIEQSNENEQLKEEIEMLKRQLDEHIITIETAGSIANAALEINGVFAAAQRAAMQYVESVKELVKRRMEGYVGNSSSTEVQYETRGADKQEQGRGQDAEVQTGEVHGETAIESDVGVKDRANEAVEIDKISEKDVFDALAGFDVTEENEYGLSADDLELLLSEANAEDNDE